MKIYAYICKVLNIYRMKSKVERHRIIRKVVGEGKIASQEELAAILESNGIQVAQATLSRDIRDLGITKFHDGEGYYYSLPLSSAQHQRVAMPGLSSSVVSLEFSGQLAVIKTMPGHANMVAAVIDGGALAEVAGTIAGDDTILLAVREGVSRDSLSLSLGRLLGALVSKRIN